MEFNSQNNDVLSRLGKIFRRSWIPWGLLLVYTVGCTKPPQRESLKLVQDEYPVKIKRVIDGDTFVADVELPFSISLRDQHIRCLGYDAYELPSTKGINAKNEFTELTKLGSVYISPGNKEKDSFGRLLADVKIYTEQATIDVAQYMKDHNFDEKH